MAKLRHSEWMDLINAINTLNSDISPETLQNRAISSVNQLISGVITAIDFFDGNGVHTGKHWYDPPDSISQSEFEIFAHVADEHPFFPDIFGKKRFRTMKISDYKSSNEFRDTAIYNEFYRIFNIENQLLIPILESPNSIITCTINRTKDNFSENQRLTLSLLGQQLRSAIINTKLFERIQKSEQILQNGFTQKSCGVIAVNSENEIIYATEFARLMLAKYFKDSRLNSKYMPEKLKTWVLSKDVTAKNEGFQKATETYFQSKDNDQLTVRYMFNSQTNETSLLLEEKVWAEPKLLKKFNLTKRETEILFWISQGKTDKDIAIICNISVRTVQNILRISI